VRVDAYSKSSVDSIWAIGDVTNRLNLTPVATCGRNVARATLFGNEPTPVDHENVPTAVFSDPNVSTVGFRRRRRANASARWMSTSRAFARSSTRSGTALRRPS
jgi:pyruvate/2-oxoglutarate dehydrogenase complex dihydrolipoamide dehydrogenase (E3) component